MTVSELLAHGRLHHVGIVVSDLDAAIANYRALGFGEALRAGGVPGGHQEHGRQW